MFLRRHQRTKDGKHHTYWSLVETVLDRPEDPVDVPWSRIAALRSRQRVGDRRALVPNDGTG